MATMKKDSIPKQMRDKSVLHWSPIDERHSVTGACQHFNLSTGQPDPAPNFVAIVSNSSGSFYLARFDRSWQFITDTWHESLDEALHQAEFEYKGVSLTWRPPMKPNNSRLKRAKQPMPDSVAQSLKKNGLMKAYQERPAYPHNDYLSWINRAKHDATREKRVQQMLRELKKGGVYMNMKHQASEKKTRLRKSTKKR